MSRPSVCARRKIVTRRTGRSLNARSSAAAIRPPETSMPSRAGPLTASDRRTGAVWSFSASSTAQKTRVSSPTDFATRK